MPSKALMADFSEGGPLALRLLWMRSTAVCFHAQRLSEDANRDSVFHLGTPGKL